MSKYEQLRDVIISNPDFSDEKKVLLLEVLDIYLTFESKEDAIELEDYIYNIDDSQMTDEERLDLEYTRLCKMNNIIAEQDPNDETAHNFFSKKVEKYAFTKDIVERKRLINECLLDVNVMPPFCSEYEFLLNKDLKLNDIKIEEYKFVKKMNR